MLEHHLRSRGADVVHAHDLPTVAVGLAAARNHGALFVADLHENWPAALRTYGYARRFPGSILISPARWERHERRILPQADRIIVVIEEARRRLVEGGIPADRIAVVKNTVHVNEFEGFGQDPAIKERFRGRFVLIYLGGFERHRGIETAIEAMPELARQVPEVLLLLVGGGASEPGLRRLAESLRVSDKVVFEGWQPFSRFPSYINASDVCLIPHAKTEHTDTTIPHKLFHYMLLSRPVLTTDCEPLKRIVREAECGLVIPSGDAGAFERAARALRDPALRERLGAAGHAAVMERYRWDLDAQVLTSLYEDISTLLRRSTR
jgi:glycosyltransferase involved in cell wall biosynthesis